MSGQTKTSSALRDVATIVDDLANEIDVIATLRLLKELHNWIAAAQTMTVGQAMAEGYTHRDIGEALEVSQQAISKRYGCGKDDDKKGGSEARQKTASNAKALVHFMPNGVYVGYSLTVELEGLAFATEPPTQRDSRQPSPDACREEPCGSDADEAVAEIAASSAGQQPWL